MVGLCLSAAGVLLAAGRIDEPPRVVRIWPIALAIAAMVVSWFLQGLAMAVLARMRLGRLRVGEMTRIYVASQGVAALTPFGGAEVPYQILEFKRLGVPVGLGGANVTLRSIINGTVLVIGATLGVLLVSGIPFVRATVLLGIVLGIAAGWAVLILLLHRRSPPEQRPAGDGWMVKLRRFLVDLRDSFARIWRQDPTAIAVCGGIMALYWAIYPLLGVFALLAAGWSGEHWFGVFTGQYLLYLVVIPISPTPGGSGTAEVGFAALMTAFVPQSALLGGVLIWRVLNHYSELVIGAFFAGHHVWDDIELAREELRSG
jgi:uncharacterized protein (TIRG00374 family)